MRRRLFRSGQQSKKVIGAAGTRSGCGTTHFVWCAANYLSNVRKKRVLVCRTGTGYDYRQAKVILKGSGDDTCLTYGNIVFLAGMDESAVLSGNEQYDCILLDLGQADYVGDNILKQCDELFLIGDLSIWHCGESASARFRMSGRYDGRIHLLAAFYSKTGLREYKKLTEDEPVVIPIDMEPFAISRDTIILMESLFGGTYI